jgi:hypothetical protein
MPVPPLVQYCSTFVSVRRSYGYAQGLLSSVDGFATGDSLIGDWTPLVERERCLVVEALVRTGANQRPAAHHGDALCYRMKKFHLD